MEFKQLEYLCAIAEEKNFTKAAKKLFITQPSISQSISSLEKEIGCQLFNRSKQGAFLNSKGEILYQYAKEALKHRDSIIEQLSNHDIVNGKFTILLKTALNPFTEMFYAFNAEYPDSHMIVIDNIKNSPDIIVSGYRDYLSDYDYIPIITEPYYILLSENNHLCKDTSEGASISIIDIAYESFILDDHFEMNNIFISYCISHGFKPTIRHICPNWTMIPDMIKQTDSCSAVFKISIKDLPHGVTYRTFKEEINRTIYLGIRKNIPNTHIASIFAKFALENYVSIYDKLYSFS